MKFKGKIEKVEMTGGTGNKGAWHRWAYKIGGRTLSTFNEEIGTKFFVGDFVEVETKTSDDGKYENMVTMVKTEDLNGSEMKQVEIKGSQIMGAFEIVTDLLRQILAELKRDEYGYAPN